MLFTDFSSFIQTKLKQYKITFFTEVQQSVIPLFLESTESFIALAPTGSGKTLSYILPVLNYIQNHPDTCVLIIAPTRDLALQIHDVVECYKPSDVFSMTTIGGTSLSRDLRNFSKRPNLIIGTPGRLLHHLNASNLKHFNISHLVIDEIDRLLQDGFKREYDLIMQVYPTSRKAFFSATLSQKLKSKILSSIKPSLNILDHCTLKHQCNTIKEQFINVSDEQQKYFRLLDQLRNVNSTVIFTNSKSRAKSLFKKLISSGIKSFVYTSDSSGSQRKRALTSFNATPGSCLVATDIASRGLDFKSLNLVVNYHVPYVPSAYIHRIGRTGRAFNNGKAITLVMPSQRKFAKNIDTFRCTNKQIIEPKKGFSKFSKDSKFKRKNFFTGYRKRNSI